MIMISVVIPIYNGANYLKNALKALENQSLDHKQFEVIAIDDGSKDNSLKILEEYSLSSPFFSFRYLSHTNSGVSNTRNVGASMCQSEFIAFLDQDAIPSKTWLEEGIKCFKDSSISVIEGRISAIKSFNATPLTHILENETGGRFMTANCIFRASVFREVGGFDLNFPYFLEDSDIAFSILKLGYKIQWAPQVLVFHPYVQKNMAQHVWQMTTLAERIPILLNKHHVNRNFCLKHGIPWHTMTACPIYFYGYFAALALFLFSWITGGLFHKDITYSLYFSSLFLFCLSYLVTLYARFRRRKVPLIEGVLFSLWYLVIPYKRLYHLIKGAIRYRVPLRLI